MDEDRTVLFHEEQTFGRWVYIVLAADLLLVAGITALLIHTNEVAEDRVSLFILILILIVPGLLTALFWTARLRTEVRPDGLYIRFVPFHRQFKRIAFESIREFYVRRYRPLAEYGGWGIRWWTSGRAYNVRGNRGVQLVLQNGKQLLIGSQRSEELAAAIESAAKRENGNCSR